MPQPATTHFVACPGNGMVISTGELLRQLAREQAVKLVDARDRARFAGDVEPIDSVAGHIPGAINFPFADSLHPDGSWKNVAALKSKWCRTLGEDKDTRWIAMCGSGVTACHIAISAQLAGFRGPLLYAGSWSEWIRDPQRPVATGDP